MINEKISNSIWDVRNKITVEDRLLYYIIILRYTNIYIYPYIKLAIISVGE